MLHYSENAGIKTSNNLVNCGIYLFSVRLFSEYGVNPFPDDDYQQSGEEEIASMLMTGGCSTPKE